MAFDKIYLDMDGTMVDLCGPLTEMVGKTIADMAPGEYNFELSLPGTNTMNRLKQWSNTGWANLPKTRDADEIFSILCEYAEKRNIIFCSIPLNGQSARGKYEWLKKHYPEQPFILTETKHVLAGKNSLLVDDCDMLIETFRAMGGKALLIPRRWNKGHALFDDGENMEGYIRKQLRGKSDGYNFFS